jgi:hypothetical protein
MKILDKILSKFKPVRPGELLYCSHWRDYSIFVGTEPTYKKLGPGWYKHKFLGPKGKSWHVVDNNKQYFLRNDGLKRVDT